jgi:hypothetical protein
MNEMTHDQIIRNAALQMAIDYHRLHEAGVSVAVAQRLGTIANAGPKPGAVVDTAAIFRAFLAGN